MVIVGCLTNYYMLFLLYATVMPMDAIIQAGHIINPNVTDLFSFVIWMIAPFNLVKAILISLFNYHCIKRWGLILKNK